MESVFVVVGLLVLFFFFVQKRYAKQDELKDSHYKKKGALLNMKETAFYNALLSAVGQHGIIMSKHDQCDSPIRNQQKEVVHCQ